MSNLSLMRDLPTPIATEAVVKINSLIFVQIPTHFKEMIRVAELLQPTGRYRPIVLFTAMYAGVNNDLKICRKQGIACLTPDDFYRYLPEPDSHESAGRFRSRIQASITAIALFFRSCAGKLTHSCGRFRQLWGQMRVAVDSLAVPIGHAPRRFATACWSRTSRMASAARRHVAQSPSLSVSMRRCVSLWRRLAPESTRRFLWLRRRATYARVHAMLQATMRFRLASGRPRMPRLSRRPWRRLAGSVWTAGLPSAAGRLRQSIWKASARASINGRFQRIVRSRWWKTVIRHIASSLLLRRLPTPTMTQWLYNQPIPLVAALRLLARVFGYPLLLPLLLLRPVLRRLAIALFGWFYRHHADAMPGDIRAQHHTWRMIPRLLEDNDIQMVVLPEDNFYYFTNLYVQAIHARNGAAVVVPFTVVNVLEWAESFHGSPSHDASVILNRIIGFLFPAWTYRHKNKPLVMPPQQVLSNEYLGIAPVIPWLINSGHADAIAAESRFMDRYYRRAGIDSRQIRFTGALYDDVLFRALGDAEGRRERLYETLGLPSGRPMILCALPPNQLGGDGRPQCVFSDYRELLAFFVAPLERLTDEYNIVISLHPRITAEDARVLEGSKFRVAGDNIAEIVPLCHFFVACCSATIRLAVSCGIPVINYDVFAYDYDDYKKVPGVITTDDRMRYLKTVEQVACSPTAYAELRTRQQEFARQQAVLDGKAGERLLQLFDHLMEQRGKDYAAGLAGQNDGEQGAATPPPETSDAMIKDHCSAMAPVRRNGLPKESGLATVIGCEIDFSRLDRYLAYRYTNLWRRFSVAAKSVLPFTVLARRQVAADPVDILLLQPNQPAARRHARLASGLVGRGLTLREETVPTVFELLAERKILVPAAGWRQLPRKWRLQAAYSAWLIETYRPRLVITFMDDSLHTPFLREALRGSGGVLANMAHTICFPNADFSMCDVDWLILFGQRSLDNLREAPVRYGSCRTIIAGSPYLQMAKSPVTVARSTGEPPRLLWLGQYFHRTHRSTLMKDLLTLSRFMSAHPGIPVAVRVHPLDRGEMRRFLDPHAPQITWLAPTSLLPQIIDDFDIVISSFSAGLIDAAAYGKPIIGFKTSGLTEALGLQDFGLPLVADEAELMAAISGITADYGSACLAASQLASQHYFGIDDATARLTDLFESLLRGEDPAGLGLPVGSLDGKDTCQEN